MASRITVTQPMERTKPSERLSGREEKGAGKRSLLPVSPLEGGLVEDFPDIRASRLAGEGMNLFRLTAFSGYSFAVHWHTSLTEASTLSTVKPK